MPLSAAELRRRTSPTANTPGDRVPESEVHPDEGHFRRAAPQATSRVGSHPSGRPEHGVGRRLRLPGAPLDRVAGDLIAGETVGYQRAVPGCSTTAASSSRRLTRFHADGRPGGRGARPCGKYRSTPLPGPGPRHVRGATDGRRAATDNDHRTGCGQTAVCGAKSSSLSKLEVPGQRRRAELCITAVEYVIPLGQRRAVVMLQ